MEMMNQLCWL